VTLWFRLPVISFGVSACLLLGALTPAAQPSPKATPRATATPTTAAVNVNISGGLTVTNPTPTPAPPAPSPAFHFYKPVIYVYAIATDAPTSARIEIEAAQQLVNARDAIQPSNFEKIGINGTYTVISAPTNWGISDLVNQCVNDPYATAGALVFFNVFSESITASQLAISKSHYQLDADAALIECTNLGSMNVIWTTNDRSGKDTSLNLTLFPLAAIGSAVQSFLTSHSHTTTTTTSFATPSTSATFPPGGVISQTTDMVTTNPLTNGGEFVGLSFLGALAANANATTLPGSNPDALARHAAAKLAQDVIERLVTDNDKKALPCARCSDWFVSPTPTPSPTPVNLGSASHPSTPSPTATPSPTPTPLHYAGPNPWPSHLSPPSIDDLNQFLAIYALPMVAATPALAEHRVIRYRQETYTIKETPPFLSISVNTSWPRFDVSGGPALCSEDPQVVRTYTAPAVSITPTAAYETALNQNRFTDVRLDSALLSVAKVVTPPSCSLLIASTPEPLQDNPAKKYVIIHLDSEPDAQRFSEMISCLVVKENAKNTQSVSCGLPDCSSLSSAFGTKRASVRFENRSGKAVTLYWIDGKSSEHYYFTVAPWGGRVQPSYLGHSWCVRDATTGQSVMAVTITGNNQDVIIPRTQ